MDISFADDDDGSMEEVRLAQQQQPNKESMKKEEEEECQRPSTDDAGQQEEMAATATTASGGRFNPTEAILATMQLLPLPCAKVMAARSGQSLATFMTAGEIERNVSLVRSYAGAGHHKKTDSNLAILALRRKSKSQMGLNDAHGRGSPAAAAATNLSVRGGGGRPAAAAVPLCDQLDELRSFQRQLQNFPSLSELQRHPLVPPSSSSQHQNYWLATGTSSYSNNRRSLSPATSRRWLLTDQQCQQGLSLANVMIQQPSSQSPISRSTSHSSSEESRSAGAATTNGRHQHNTESYALAILQIVQVKMNKSTDCRIGWPVERCCDKRRASCWDLRHVAQLFIDFFRWEWRLMIHLPYFIPVLYRRTEYWMAGIDGAGHCQRPWQRIDVPGIGRDAGIDQNGGSGGDGQSEYQRWRWRQQQQQRLCAGRFSLRRRPSSRRYPKPIHLPRNSRSEFH